MSHCLCPQEELTSIIMVCFKLLVKTFAPLNSQTKFEVSWSLHSEETGHLTTLPALPRTPHSPTWNRRAPMWECWLTTVQYSSINILVPSKLIVKLKDLGLNIDLCECILSIFTGRHQELQIGTNAFSTGSTLTPFRVQYPALFPGYLGLGGWVSFNTINKFADTPVQHHVIRK